MHERDEIKRVLAAAGEPPPPGADTARAVWARLGRERQQTPAEHRWSWLPRGWQIGCVVGCALALGVITAEWRLRRTAITSPDHHRYLASIDPTVALRAKGLP
jgi:hypothetical protein